MSREIPEDKEAAEDPQRFEAGEQQDFTFQANYEMLLNVFKTGISTQSVYLRDKTPFQY